MRNLLAAAALLALLLPARADDAADLDSVFKNVDAKAETLKDLKAAFKQEKTMKVLKRPIVVKGNISVKKAEKGTRICWESWESDPDTGEKSAPQRMLILGDESKLISYSLDEKAGEWTDLGKGKFEVQEFLAIGSSLSGMKKSFGVELAGKPAEGKGWELKLTPTSERLKKFIKELRIEVDPKEWVVSRIFVLEVTGDTIDIRMSGFEMNKGVDETLYKVPADVKLEEVKLEGK
ncbi:MAG: outer membrane lipoprotein carrier protein LolA [Planctomycetota bacterium]